MTTETVMYVGRRTGAKGLVYAYLDEAEMTAFYAQPLTPAVAIGTLIRITHPADSSTKYFSSGDYGPRIVGFADQISADQLLEWQVRDRAAWQRKADADAAKRAARRADVLEEHVHALAVAAATLSHAERGAFASWIAQRIQKGA